MRTEQTYSRLRPRALTEQDRLRLLVRGNVVALALLFADLEGTFDGRTRVDGIEPALDVCKIVDVLALADFGPAPRSLLESPAYAWRVYFRKKELAAERDRHRRLLQQAEEEWRADLARVVEALKRSLVDGHPVRALLQPLNQFEELADGRGVALAQTSARFDADVAGIDARLATLGAERTKAEELLAVASGLDLV